MAHVATWVELRARLAVRRAIAIRVLGQWETKADLSVGEQQLATKKLLLSKRFSNYRRYILS